MTAADIGKALIGPLWMWACIAVLVLCLEGVAWLVETRPTEAQKAAVSAWSECFNRAMWASINSGQTEENWNGEAVLRRCSDRHPFPTAPNSQ